VKKVNPDTLPIAFTWGSLPEEWEQDFACDRYLPECDHIVQRGIDIAASSEIVFRWLCQMKVAPYSYDWIDNLGRLSPRKLTPGVQQLTIGEPVMTIFALVDFSKPSHLTLQMKNRHAIHIFGEVALTYRVTATAPQHSRLAVRMRLRYPKVGLWKIMRWCLPWGDLIMMRKQLMLFKQLAETQPLSFLEH